MKDTSRCQVHPACYVRSEERYPDGTLIPAVGCGECEQAELRKRGMYRKYRVSRVDESPKHNGCEYFVLDMTHDRNAIPAALAYARSCETEYPGLASDLRAQVARCLSDSQRSLTCCPHGYIRGEGQGCGAACELVNGKGVM